MTELKNDIGKGDALMEKVLRIGDAVECEKSGNVSEDIVRFTQKTMLMIETNIKNKPEQWFWFHDRWRRRSGQIRSEDEE